MQSNELIGLLESRLPPQSVQDAIEPVTRQLDLLGARLQHGPLQTLPQVYWLVGEVGIWDSLCRGLRRADADDDGPGRLARLASAATLAACSSALARIDAVLASQPTQEGSEASSRYQERVAPRRADRLSRDVSLPHSSHQSALASIGASS